MELNALQKKSAKTMAMQNARDALLPCICAHAFYNVEAKLLGSQWLWRREGRRDPHL
jgi:hypothetical protein